MTADRLAQALRALLDADDRHIIGSERAAKAEARKALAEHQAQAPAEAHDNSTTHVAESLLALASRIEQANETPIAISVTAARFIRAALATQPQPKGTEPPGWVGPELTPESMTDLAVAIGELSQAMGSPCVMGRAPQTLKSQTVRLAASRLKEVPSPQPAHTPGPWSARAFPAYGYGITASDSQQARESFAVVHFADTSRGRTTERAKADARLIAAAPELLEVLKELLLCASYGAVLEDADVWIDARAAIAKATGAQA